EGMGQQIEILQSDSAGYVLQIRIGEQELKGEVVRQKLGLHSACFQIIKKEDGVLFKSKGLGHGLGMSQYTANVMAQNGSQFMDILTYFFHDITIEKYE
ncbi:MAG: stage II sporulation protein D, partial [Lachnospiraceae bacterium]